ncbi:unnamed protein product [Periconia digitata]|uniref:Uncharacterized protein n=1 Tax=Periconia digitata TaxID=1303443 RepID=A0A9W4XQ29_9PLEO|nr:unnamed protein product [Periconia digitata]
MKTQMDDDRDRVDSIHLEGEGHSSIPTIPQILATKDQFNISVQRVEADNNPFASEEDDDDDDDDDQPTLAYSATVRRPKTMAQIDSMDGKTKACDRNTTFDSFIANEKLATAKKDKSLSHNSQMLRGLRKIFRVGRRK